MNAGAVFDQVKPSVPAPLKQISRPCSQLIAEHMGESRSIQDFTEYIIMVPIIIERGWYSMHGAQASQVARLIPYDGRARDSGRACLATEKDPV